MSASLFARLCNHPKIFQTLCCISLENFLVMIKKLQPHWNEMMATKKAIGRPSLSLEDELLMLIIYYRVYASQRWMGILFHLDVANVCRHLKRLEPLVAKVFHIQKERQFSQEEAQRLIVDATEIQTQRPKKQGKQRKLYSGKKKRHTQKVEIIIDARTKRIANVSKIFPGRTHDFKIRKQSDHVPRETFLLADSGYTGLSKIHDRSIIPVKRKRGELSAEDKFHNKLLASARIAIEHVFGHLKRWKIIGSVYRNGSRRLNMRVNIIAGIYNEFLS